ncbi:hypothetical protein FYN96_23045 [Salmonella enterica]|nr:hypothetical protein [Salmonella enterica]EEH7943838.1 hypothetical protein [Salmonella enterica]EID4122193.1 hypothetical protein [Salmonella enterica]
MTYSKNIIPGHGRTKGALNRSTIERTELFRKKLDETNIIFRAVDLAVKKLEEGENDTAKIKLDTIVNLITKFAPYYMQNVAAEQISEQIAAITSRDDAEQVAAMLAGQLRLVR